MSFRGDNHSFTLRPSTASPSTFAQPAQPSAVFAPSTLTGPGQSDMALLDDLTASIKFEARRAVINKNQVANAAQRLMAVSAVLMKLPDSRPTPQLLAVFQSTDQLLKAMSRSPVWECVLREQFLCQDRFAALRERLRSVWQLHPTARWEDQDRRAALEDERTNAQVLLRLVGPHWLTLNDLLGPAFRGLGSWNGAGNGKGRQSTMRREDPRRASSGAGAEAVLELLPAASKEDLDEERQRLLLRSRTAAAAASGGGNGGATTGSNDAVTQLCSTDLVTEDDIIALYRRRHLSAWKLRYEDLDRPIQAAYRHCGISVSAGARDARSGSGAGAAGDSATPLSDSLSSASSSASLASSAMTGDGFGGRFGGSIDSSRSGSETNSEVGTKPGVAARFRVRTGFLYGGHPVVVKELRDSPDLSLSPNTITSFVQDAIARSRWCHPFLPRYHGAFTEKFMTQEQEKSMRRLAAEAGLPYYSLLPNADRAETHACTRETHERTHSHNHSTSNLRHADVGAAALYPRLQSASSEQLQRRGSHTSVAIAAHQAQPVLVLGLIMEDVGFSAAAAGIATDVANAESDVNTATTGSALSPRTRTELAPHPLAREERDDGLQRSIEVSATCTSSTAGAMTDAPEYACLAELLFKERIRLSFLDAIDVAMQAGEALQYLSLDQDNVPPEVHTAWLSISPSNVFIAEVPPPPMPRGRQAGEGRSFLGREFTAVPRGNPFLSQANCGFGFGMHARQDTLTSDVFDASREHSTVFSRYSFASPTDTGLVAAARPPRRSSCTTEPPSFAFHEFPMPYVVIRPDAGCTRVACKGRTPPATRLVAATARVPVLVRERVAVKYAPPSYIEHGPVSRWRPHPRAASPASYALAQLLLAALTGQPPYRHLRTQRQIAARLGPRGGYAGRIPAGSDDATATAATTGLGYMIPPTLPLPLRALLRLALSLTPLTAEDYLVDRFRDPATAATTGAGPSVGSSASPFPSNITAHGGENTIPDQEEEDCIYLLSRLQGSSCNVATNSSATFADSDVNRGGATAASAVPRALTLQMFMEGLAVVGELMELRGVGRSATLRMPSEPRDGHGAPRGAAVDGGRGSNASGANMPATARGAAAVSGRLLPSQRYVDPNTTVVDVIGDDSGAGCTGFRVHSDEPLDDYGEI